MLIKISVSLAAELYLQSGTCCLTGWSQTVSVCVGGGGIFTVRMLTFSGKSDEKVMGVNGFDCPAIFLGAGALNF